MLAGCVQAGIPVPVLTSPVQGTSQVGPYGLNGGAPERALVGPCVTAATTITVAVDSPNSDVNVSFAKPSDGGYEEFAYRTIPAGAGSTSIDVPSGCYRIFIVAALQYCDGREVVGAPFPCEIVLPPTYQFQYTVTF